MADDYLAQRFLRPSARIGLGQSLVDIASAAIDISDGLYGDLYKLLSASGPAGTALEGRVQELEKELRRVEQERDILKKALAIFSQKT